VADVVVAPWGARWGAAVAARLEAKVGDVMVAGGAVGVR
jgi:hypothetical protein